ncbi:MAG TPA: sigma-70 family RNA polymerase sigma factor [Ilumatobacteraceae bacterium]|jgi:RNA polymerase sigma-70 factor, ECF subfamily|nr:sigma-70 family RNA polymerase sigma factor [Ilumatobacteraceae bacterium]
MKVKARTEESPMCLPAAFAEFYDQAAREVFRYLARALLGDRAAAEDLTQETFAAVVIAARTGRPEALTMPWVMGVARHKLVDHHRRAARDQRRLALAWAQSSESGDLDPLDNADPARVLEMMRNLSPEHRLVLILKYVDGLAVQEIATTLNRSQHATNSLLSRARRALATSVAESSS